MCQGSYQNKSMKVVFAGTPEFARTALEALLDAGFDVPLVLTQPDRPAGRGLRLHASPVKQLALASGIAVAQPRSLRLDGKYPEDAAAAQAALRQARPDVMVVAAYGLILPQWVLALPCHGCLNIHASLLPRWRGAAPIQHALIAGDEESGVTIMQTEEGLDTGPIRLQRRVKVLADDDAVSLAATLAQLGAEVLTEALTLLVEGSLPLTPQDEAAATAAPPLTAEDGHVRWRDTATSIANRHRGVALWPGTSFGHAGGRVKVLGLVAHQDADAKGAPPGQVLSLGPESVVVAAGTGTVELLEVKPASRGAMSARAWANGRGVKAGVTLV